MDGSSGDEHLSLSTVLSSFQIDFGSSCLSSSLVRNEVIRYGIFFFLLATFYIYLTYFVFLSCKMTLYSVAKTARLKPGFTID